MNRIKEIRVMREKSQVEVAKAIGLSQQSYQRYEIEGNIPSGDILAKLADYYGVSVDYLLDRTEYKEKAADVITDRDFAVIHRAYNKLAGKEKDKLKKMLALTFDIAFEEENDSD